MSLPTQTALAELAPYSVEQLENIETIRMLFDAIGEGRQEESSREIASPNFIRHDLTGVNPNVRKQAGAKRFIDDIRSLLPDFKLSIEDIMAAEDKVIVRFVASGTHSGGRFLGVEPTGKVVAFYNINIYRFKNGQVEETWQLADLTGAAKQLRGKNRR